MPPTEEEQYEYVEEQPPIDKRGMGAYPTPLDRFGSHIATLTNPSEALYRFELFLRCLKENDEGDLIKIGGKLWKPLMNDIGINSILLTMQSIVNPMTPLSNLDDREVGVLIETLSWNLVDDMAFNRKKYQVDEVSRRIISGAALRFCYVFLKRPYEEGDRKFFKGITQEITHTSEIRKPRGSMSLNPMNWFRGGK